MKQIINKYLHCNVRKSIGMIIIFVVIVLLMYSYSFIEISTVINNDVFTRNHKLFSNNNSYYFNKISNVTNVTAQSKEGSFFISLSYFEQLTCAAHSLLSTGNVAENLGAKVVMPFLLRSRLYGIPDLIPDREVPDVFYPLRTVFDIKQLNATFYSLSNNYLVDFENFLYNAPREIVMIDAIHKHVAPKELSLNLTSVTKLLNKMKFHSYNIFDCSKVVFKHRQPLLEKVELMLRISTRHLGVEEFTITKYICLNPAADVTTDELKALIGPEPRTIMFIQWRGCAYYRCNIKMTGSITSPFRYRILYHANHSESMPLISNVSIPLSNTIKLTALQYLHKFKIASPFISVHIRIEKLSRVNARIYGHTACCLEILRSLLKILKQEYFNNTLLITDIGDYGSDACYDKVCLPHSRWVKGMLNRMGLKRHQFNPDTMHSSNNPAFASLVEMKMLAKGKVLIVVGQGSFKHQLIRDFLNSNPINRLYHICTEHDNVLNEFSDDLNRDCWNKNTS